VKKQLFLMLILVLGTCLMAQTPVQPSGSGTENDPYEVETLGHLLWVTSNGGYALQQNDIDASATSTWYSDGEGGYYGWPLVAYSGNYSGQGYEISNLYMNRESSNGAGLFGTATGPYGGVNQITGVKLVNASIAGSQDVGGIVGLSTKYNISECHVSGSISGSSNVGGIAGRYNGEFNIGVTLQKCYSSASISASSNAGGLIGQTTGATNGTATVKDCYAEGPVTSVFNSGGFIGNIVKSEIMFCYCIGAVNSGGGLIGNSDAGGEGGSVVWYSYWDYEKVKQYGSAGGDLKSTSQMKTQSTYTLWDFSDTWSINSSINDGYPYLQDVPTEDALPITLSDFTAEYQEGKVLVNWSTASETDNARFLIYRNDEVIATKDGAGTTSEPHEYAYVDNDIIPGISYTYALADLSYANELTIHTDHAVTVIIPENGIDEQFALAANYPNPFNPTTVIPYTIKNSGQVNLNIYDMNGELVRTLMNEELPAGHHEVIWDGKNNAGMDVTTGMYISTLTAGDQSDSRKMLLIK